MKRLKFISIVALLLSILVISCKKEDNSTPSKTNVPTILTQGNWRITLYNDSGADELYHFSGYTFTFSNGIVTAVKNGNSVIGSYSTVIDDSKNKMLLNFGNTVPFDELNDDWHIVEETSNKIRLQDVSGGSGETDLLTFERN